MCFGPLKRLCHWGPLMALGIVKLVSYMMVHCSCMMLPPTESLVGLLNLSIFLTLCALTLYNFLSALFEGPGHLPLNWVPEYAKDEAYLQTCKVCGGFKAPRAHHCRKCGRCVLKMDHHCPWINNCVGHANHAHFTAFLLFSVCGCAHAAVVLVLSLYRAVHKGWYVEQGFYRGLQFNLTTLVLCVFSLGLAIGVVLAVGMLFFFQIRAILRNRTGIEDWIVEKATYRRGPDDPKFVYPYDLGCWNNFTQVINWGSGPVGDGISWPVVKGCSQYTLTMEQKAQKEEKRNRARWYVAKKAYSGRICPLSLGLGVACRIPLTDEPRIPLSPSDTIIVTRWRKWKSSKDTVGPVLYKMEAWTSLFGWEFRFNLD